MNKPSMSFVTLALCTAVSASAAPLFSDDFNRAVSNTVGGGWTEVESDASDVSLISRSAGDQAMQVRDDDPQAIASQLGGISTIGYTNISLSYEWAPTNNTESGDFLWVEWRNGSAGTWTEVIRHGLIGPSDHQLAHWDIAAAGLADFQFRFRVAVNANNEGATIDNVTLAGDPVAANVVNAANAVPEPGSLVLSGLGLGLLAFLGRRKAYPG